MSAKYLEIPLNTVAASGTMDFVINSRASSPISTGNNSSLGEVNAISAPGGTNSNYPVGNTAAVATTVAPAGGAGLTVDITVSAGGVVTNVAVNTAGLGYGAANTVTISAGDENATFTVTSIGNLGSNGNIVNATNAGLGVVAGDKVYNVTAGTTGTVANRINDNQITCVTPLFPLGGELFATRKLNQLDSSGAAFTTRKVRVGDIVKNTTAGTNTTVAALIDDTTLTLTADLFNSGTLFNDNFTIEPLATQLYDPTGAFLTSVTTDDVIENTTTNVSGGVVSIQDDFRVTTTQAAMFGDGNSFSVFDQSSSSSKVYLIDSVISSDWASTTTTTVNLNSINVNADTITITHSDQGIEGNRLVATAIENTLINAVLGPLTPSVKVPMPIFNNQLVVIESIVVG